VTGELFVADLATTTVASGGTDAPAAGTSETLTVASSAMFGAAVTGVSWFYFADAAAGYGSEMFKATNVSGTTWTVTRGADGTTPVAHLPGFTVYQVVTAGWLASVMAGVLQPSGDVTGAKDTAAVNAAITALGAGGGAVYIAAGAWYWQCGGITVDVPGISIIHLGPKWACIVNAVGTGTPVRMYSTTSYSPGDVAGGGLEGMIFDGASAGAGSSAFHIGDIYNLRFDVGVRNFQGTGSKGAWLDNNYWFAEMMRGEIWVEECTSGVVFDNSADTSGSATGSFDRAVLDIYLDQKGKGNCVTFANGAFMTNHRLGVYGNTDYGAALYYVLTVTGSNTANGFSLLSNGALNIGVECNGTSGTQPGTILFGTQASNLITGCTGIIDFSGNNPFASAPVFFESFKFDGPVYGDTKLKSSGPLGFYRDTSSGTLSNGSEIFTKFEALVEVVTTGNVTGIILQGFTNDDWRLCYVINNGTGTITFAAAATSKVASGVSCVIQPNSAQAFVWNNDAALWFAVS
jgi:hypothetical protein